jgi:hypothetical protein
VHVVDMPCLPQSGRRARPQDSAAGLFHQEAPGDAARRQRCILRRDNNHVSMKRCERSYEEKGLRESTGERYQAVRLPTCTGIASKLNCTSPE